MNRVKDHEGDLWPVTGCQCLVCKWPLIPVAGSKVHPNCDQGDREDQ